MQLQVNHTSVNLNCPFRKEHWLTINFTCWCANVNRYLRFLARRNNCQSLAKWSPAVHRCVCVCSNAQKETLWGWYKVWHLQMGVVLTAQHREGAHQNWQRRFTHMRQVTVSGSAVQKVLLPAASSSMTGSACSMFFYFNFECWVSRFSV